MNGRNIDQIDMSDSRAIIDFIESTSINEVIPFINKYRCSNARKDLTKKKVREMTDDEIICLALTRGPYEFYDNKWKRVLASNQNWAKYGVNTRNHLNLIGSLLYPAFRPHEECRLVSLEFPSLLTKEERKYIRGQQDIFVEQLDTYPTDRFLNLSEMYLGKVKLNHKDLCHLRLDHTRLDQAKFAETNLSNVTFYMSHLNEADLHRANLKKTNFGNGYLQKANLREANLKKANLDEAWFYGSDLRRAKLKKANLQWAFFKGANFKGANLIGTTFEHTRFQGAKFNEKTKILPLLEQIRKNPSIKSMKKEELLDLLSKQLNQLEIKNKKIGDGIHSVRWVITKNIEAVMNFIDDKETKLALLDAAVQHPIFSHRHAFKKYANSVLGLFITYQISTDSQDILMKLQNKINNRKTLGR